MASRTLDDFRVRSVAPIGGLKDYEVTDPSRMYILKTVADDEGSQTKAFNYIFDRRGLACRGFSESETSHPAWNAFKKAYAH